MMVRRPAARVPSALGALALSVGIFLYAFTSPPTAASSTETVQIRGHSQTLHTYGSRGGEPVIVSSGDGGWVHLGPHIAADARGAWVLRGGLRRQELPAGFHLNRKATLRPEDVPADYCALLEFASRGASVKPVLIGVSEGAGLSILAAADRRTHIAAAGVVGIGAANHERARMAMAGLADLHHARRAERADLQHAAVIGQVAPLPVASIHSTHDEFVSQEEARDLLSHAAEPKRLWIVSASDHRFSDNLAEFDARLLEALAWVRGRPSH